MMQGQNLQYWAKERFFLVLNILPASGDRKETAIALACGMGQATTPAGARPTATITPQPPTATVAASAPTPAGETTTTDFEKPLDRNWYRQGGMDAEVGVEARPGYLRFTAGSGNDLFPGTNFDAPTLFRVIGGDFTLETAVEFDPQEYYQGAGLFIWQDQDNFVRLERCFDGESGVCFLKVEKGSPEVITTAGAIPTTAGRVELRLQKTGNRVAAWWRDAAAAAWQTVGSTEIELPGGPQPLTKKSLRGGMLLCVEQGAAEISADFDYLRITQ
jgi:beta-xylosidase